MAVKIAVGMVDKASGGARIVTVNLSDWAAALPTYVSQG